MTGRTHESDIGGGLWAEFETEANVPHLDTVEVRGSCALDVVGLAARDIEHREDVPQRGEVVCLRCYYTCEPALPQDSGELREVARCEHVKNRVHGPVGQRKGPPEIPYDGGCAGKLCRSPERVAGEVERDGARARGAAEQCGEVVAGSGAGIERGASPAVVVTKRWGSSASDRRGDRLVVPCGEEPLSGCDHFGCVRPETGSSPGEEIDVALACCVKAMPRNAHERALCRVGCPPAAGAHRAAEELLGGEGHGFHASRDGRD